MRTKEKPSSKAAKPRTNSNTYKIRLAVVKKPGISFERVVKAVGLKGKAAKLSSHSYNTWEHARSVIALFKGTKR